ncbi:MAG: flippase-like domain-containing protein [Deltaproteobacteria bacterium]|nr:flippase-like domain-containing protein [Deltaproteobacteria bacterium]
MTKLVAWVALFACLTIAGSIWAISRAPIDADKLWAVISALPLGTLVLLAALCVGIYAADALRYRALGAAIDATVTWRAAIDTSVANFFFSWITPGSTFGAPATIYMLGRRGVPWDAAVVIAFAKAFSGVAVVVLASFAFVAFGLGPDYDGGVFAVVVFGGAVFATLFGLLTVAVFRVEPAKRVSARIFASLGRRFRGSKLLASAGTVTASSIDRLALLRSGGLAPLAYLVVTHVIYFAMFAGVGVVLLHAFGRDVDVRAFAAVIVYIAFTYLAPTPGGAGFAEAMALPFFGPLLPADKAVMFVLCFRGLTLYLQVGFAIPYMVIVGGGREIAARAARKPERHE